MPQSLDDTNAVPREKGGLALWIILVAALALRWIHLLLVSGTDLVKIPIIDSAFYHHWATLIAQGHVVGKQTFFMSPLYAYLMGLVYAVFGAAPWAVMALQGILGTATVWMVFRISARLAGRTAALIAAGSAAVYAPFIFYDSTLLTSELILFLSALILNFTCDALERDRPSDLWKLGVAIGLSALARPMALIFLPFLALLLLVRRKNLWLKKAGLVVLAAFLVLLPVLIRNLIVGGEATLTTSSGGMNFYVGNNPNATGLYWEAPFISSVEPWNEDEEYRRQASEEAGKELTTREAGSYWFHQSLDWMLNHPGKYLLLLGRKAYYFFNQTEFANNVSIYLGRELSPLLRLNPFGWWLVAPLGFAGLILLQRRKGWSEVAAPGLWLAAYFVGILLFFNASEYRLPVALVLHLGVGGFVYELIHRIRTRKLEPILGALILALLFMPLVNTRTQFIREGQNARMDWFNLGNTLVKQGLYEQAIPRFQKAVTMDPYFAEGLHRLVDAYYRTGQRDKAVEIGRKIGLENPESVLEIVQGEAMREAYSLLSEGRLGEAMSEFGVAGLNPQEAVAETTRVGRLMRAQRSYQAGDHEDALNMFKMIRQEDSKVDPSISYNIAFILWQQGETDSAEYYATEAITADTLNVAAAFFLARIFNATDRHEEAERLMRRVNPNTEEAQKLLAVVRVRMDSLITCREWAAALEAYRPYGKLGYEMDPEDKLRIGRLQVEVGNYDLGLRLLGEAEIAGALAPDIHYYKGLACAALGRLPDAIDEYQKAVVMEPEGIRPRMALARAYLFQGKTDRAWKELDAVSYVVILEEPLKVEYQALSDSVKARL